MSIKLQYQQTYLALQKALMAMLYKTTEKDKRDKIQKEIKEVGKVYQETIKEL